ncbi:MAG: hypothetical protein BWY75_00922 [bacterium ADurb.Bin425]|nr:MAG: hypothetical protein BWY75_00922 [bacterium ADurb.Bin425]
MLDSGQRVQMKLFRSASSALGQSQAAEPVEEQNAAAGDQGEEHGDDAHHSRVETEVAGDAVADAAEDFVAAGTTGDAGLVHEDENDGQKNDRTDCQSHVFFLAVK